MRLSAPIVLLLFISAVNTTSFGVSDGYAACYGDGVMAFDQSGKDKNALYIVTWGTPPGISKISRIALPRPQGSYSQGLKCDKDKGVDSHERSAAYIRNQGIDKVQNVRHGDFLKRPEVSPNHFG